MHEAWVAGDMGRKSMWVVALAAVAAAGLVVANRRPDTGTPQVTGVATDTAEVRRVDVAERRVVNGTLGYAGTYNVIAPGPGLLTRLPAVGTVIGRGQAVYEIDGKPVTLMYGQRPSWRAFELGMTNGADVEQLETNLKQLGHGDGLTVDQRFTIATYNAIRRWQQAVNLTVTGSVPLGQVVFMPNALRIGAHDLRPGQQVGPGALVEHGNSDEPAVTMQLSPQQLPNAKVGDPVMVTLPDRTTRSGTITDIGAVATPSSGSGNDPNTGPNTASESTTPVTIRVDGAIQGFLDQAQVQVAITVESHSKVLAVPITALNALPGGAYEVIVVDGTTTRRIAVRTGLFDETAGLAEVDGSGLAEGQKVQVPHEGP